MICPKCGATIPEDCLMCENCGTEIQMVPDFEPDVDIQIDDIIADVSGTLVETVKEEVAETDDPDERPFEQGSSEQKISEDEFADNPFRDDEISVRTRVRIGLILLAGTFIVGLLCLFMFIIVRNNSPEYLVKKAKEMAENGSYEEAIAFLEKAQDKEPSDSDVLFMKADYEIRAGKDAEAVEVWNNMIDDDSRFKDNIKFLAYDKLIKYYQDAEDYQAINAVLTECKYDSIVSSYQNFLAIKPEFSVEEGTYDEVISVKLNSNTSGKIYYTTDGSTPTEKSDIYSGPITLETGEYVISAMFVNIYGIHSEVVTKKYHIELIRPAQPEVSLESGVYYEPKMIAVLCESGCRIFYTTDGSEPTQDSVPYSGSIPMPLGSTEFKFVTMNSAGIYSEPLIRMYELKLAGGIPTDQAVELLIDDLVEKGYIDDREGHRANTNGRYSYHFSSVIRTADGKDYYTINEYFDDGTGVPVRTDVVYLAGVTDGKVARLGFDDVGRFTAVPY